MENIISLIGYALSQLARAFSLALLLALLLEGAAALEIWFRNRRQSNTASSILPRKTNQFTARQTIVYINGEQFPVVQGSVVVSTSNEIQQADQSSFVDV